MKVLFFFENHVAGGGSKYVLDCINSAFQLTDDVHILSNSEAFTPREISTLAKPAERTFIVLSERGRLAEALLGKTRAAVALRKLLVFFTPLFLLVNAARTYSSLKQIRPDILVSFNGGYPAAESSLAAVLAAGRLDIPAALVVLSQPIARRGYLLFYDRLLDHMVFDSVRGIIANSSLQLKDLASLRSAPKDKFIRVFNGISDALPQSRSERDRMPRHLVIGVVCRLEQLKGLNYLIDAVAALNQERLRVELHIIGEGSERQNLERQIHRLGLAKSVKMLGHIPRDLAAEIAKFDIYAFPSLREGLPYSILEALRAGLPIVSTNVGGISDAIHDGVDGLLVPPASPKALERAIDRLMNDPEFSARLGRNARSRFEESFTLERMSREFCGVVRDFSKGRA